MPTPVLVDNQFWLQVMGDHAIIIFENLPPVEANEIQKAGEFISQFNDLLTEARENITAEHAQKLIERALIATKNLRNFQLQILKKMLTTHFRSNLSTAIINHMVNEADEYILNLGLYKNDTVPSFHSIHYHLIWMLDTMGHASVVQSYSSYPFQEIVEQATYFMHQFTILYNKAIEFGGYLRTGLYNFSAIDKLNNSTYEQIRLFTEFLVDLELQITKKEIDIPLAILFLDHMYREQCYYLTRLASVNGTKKPACDPAAPRKILQI